MAKFRANAAGDIIQFASTYQQEIGSFANPPPGTVYELQLDEETNAGLISAYNANSSQFRMDGGTLTQNAIEATINPPAAFYALFLNRVAMQAKLGTADAFTTEEQHRLAAGVFRALGLD